MRAVALLDEVQLQSTRARADPNGIRSTTRWCTNELDPVLDAVSRLPGVNYFERRIDSSDLLPELTCCLT